jgi:hypothetical protein
VLAFLDFEASSLGKTSYPIEVAWVFEDGNEEAYLIRPAPSWDDWDVRSETIHGIPRETLIRDGASHEIVAARMMDRLGGHDLVASAPSWDGKWLSALLRAAGLPRHALRLHDTEDAQRAAARAILVGVVPPHELDMAVASAIAASGARRRVEHPAHRALADARAERDRWLAVRAAATAEAERRRG